LFLCRTLILREEEEEDYASVFAAGGGIPRETEMMIILRLNKMLRRSLVFF
jgi:hypothetical protein